MADRPKSHGRQLSEARGINAAARADTDRRRAECPYRKRAAQLRSKARWRKVRDQKLRANPLCEICEKAGRTEVAEQVDHIVPIVTLLRRWPAHLVPMRTPAEVFALSNLQSICTTCHAAKSAAERSGGV